ncbi:STAS domain-containing protein [Rhizomonospora bruguierae]|uniref:STAS domain-containing protein n=1 Tax=Rhizomonospora bruguierae TaxID=1581705 RepID=UPI001BCEE646|nr:STAS domain-containing protein [Micromonospora sp. NBRC 107566]
MTVRIVEPSIAGPSPASTVRITVRGAVDVATAAELRDEILAVLARSRPRLIVLDFRSVSFIDSTGIGALVAGHKAATVTGAELRLENLSAFAHRQLWITGLLGLFGYPAPSAPPEADLPAAM